MGDVCSGYHNNNIIITITTIIITTKQLKLTITTGDAKMYNSVNPKY